MTEQQTENLPEAAVFNPAPGVEIVRARGTVFGRIHGRFYGEAELRALLAAVNAERERRGLA